MARRENGRDRIKWGRLYGMEPGGVACVLWIFGVIFAL